MMENHDDLKTRELVASISAIFRKLENLISNLSYDENHVIAINESLGVLNNYGKMVPLKYQKFFFKHFDDLILDLQKKIVSNTSKTIANKNKMEIGELTSQIRFVIRSLECLLANHSGNGKKALIINTLFKSLDELKTIVPQKYQKIFCKHYDHLKGKLTKKPILPKSIPAIRPASYRYPEKSSNRRITATATKPVRESKWTSERDYRYFMKTTLEKTHDPFLAKRLRRI